MLANGAAAYCMMEDVDCSVEGWGWAVIIGFFAVALLAAWWMDRHP